MHIFHIQTESKLVTTTYSRNPLEVTAIFLDTNNDYNDCRMMEILELPVPETMYMVGNGCSVGWTLNSGDGLFKIENARNPHLYSWTGEFNAGGEIKISLGGSSWGEDPFFFAPEAATDPLTNHHIQTESKLVTTTYSRNPLEVTAIFFQTILCQVMIC